MEKFEHIIDDIELSKIHAKQAGLVIACVGFAGSVLDTLVTYGDFSGTNFWIAAMFAALLYFIVYGLAYWVLNLKNFHIVGDGIAAKETAETLVVDIPPPALDTVFFLPDGLRMHDYQTVLDRIESMAIGADGKPRQVSQNTMHTNRISRFEGRPSKAAKMIDWLEQLGVLDVNGYLTAVPLPPLSNVKTSPTQGGVSRDTTGGTDEHRPVSRITSRVGEVENYE
ncbi:MAG: hypothetical protein GY938_26960 [Ketobacter sp.]|nr:hypothetical protein [Ketobacter sp.]